MSNMGISGYEYKPHRVNGVLIALIAVSLLFVGAAAFGFWAYTGRQDYKNNADQKAEAAAQAATEQTKADDAVKYAEEAKNPLKTYVGPSQYGSVTVQYPKTWSGYVNETTTGNTPVDDYFHPDVVPSTERGTNPFALRIQVVDQTYDKVVASYKTLIQNNKATASAYSLPKVPNTVGTRIDGELLNKKQGSMIILPLRNLTLEISTEAEQYEPDFNNIILPNLVFSP